MPAHPKTETQTVTGKIHQHTDVNRNRHTDNILSDKN